EIPEHGQQLVEIGQPGLGIVLGDIVGMLVYHGDHAGGSEAGFENDEVSGLENLVRHSGGLDVGRGDGHLNVFRRKRVLHLIVPMQPILPWERPEIQPSDIGPRNQTSSGREGPDSSVGGRPPEGTIQIPLARAWMSMEAFSNSSTRNFLSPEER